MGFCAFRVDVGGTTCDLKGNGSGGMIVLPIVERELRTASRRPQTHWVRL